MSYVLISDTYPTRDQLASGANHLVVDGLASSASTLVCPFQHHASKPGKKILKYSPTKEDERIRQSLKLLKTVRDDFRTADYAQSFNWSEISQEYNRLQNSHAHLPSRDSSEKLSWYAVVFRSRRRADCNNVDLFMADKNAYEEAYQMTNGSLLVYWYTDLDADNNCLATCVWSSRDIARSVNSLPAHKEAASLAAGSYVHYHIDRYRIQWRTEDKSFDLTPCIVTY
ncbi:hypothetical protein GGF37_003204 [Kickxella alabastrina]|nr:hypothetical protein GGF37_003204 [Kickxella alabastrina]